MPTVYAIAGPNGAGKTTFARVFLPRYADCVQFVNVDLIAAGLSPFDPAAAGFAAGRLVLAEITRHMRAGTDFAFETTLSGRTYLPVLRRAKSTGYTVVLIYLWLPDADLAVARVADRVSQGGHDVPEADVRRRFHRSLHNLFGEYRPLVDTLLVLDNSEQRARPVLLGEGGTTEVFGPERYRLLTEAGP